MKFLLLLGSHTERLGLVIRNGRTLYDSETLHVRYQVLVRLLPGVLYFLVHVGMCQPRRGDSNLFVRN